GNLIPAQNNGQLHPLPGVWRFVHSPGSLQHLDEEESQSPYSLMDRVVGELLVAEQVGSVFADLFRTELVGRTVKMSREIVDDSEISASSGISVIATLEFIEHQFS